jgi:hypothetical protein
VADRNGPTMLARSGVMEALNATVFASSIRSKRSRIGGVARWREIDKPPWAGARWSRLGTT